MLSLTFLGVGSAFAKRNLQSNALIEAWSQGPNEQRTPDDTLLVDFGTTGPIALHRLQNLPGFTYLKRDGCTHYPAIRRIFITHQHGDHVGGLEELAGMNTHCCRDPDTGAIFKPQLIGSSDLLADLWEHSLKGGLGVLHGKAARLEDYFQVVGLQVDSQSGLDRFTMLDRYEFAIFRTDHLRIKHKFDWPSFGLSIFDPTTRESVVYSGDTRFDPDTFSERMAAARMIFAEVQLEDQPDAVHATLSELSTQPEPVRRKTVLYHYGDNWDSDAYSFVATEFAGFALPQRRYTLFE